MYNTLLLHLLWCRGLTGRVVALRPLNVLFHFLGVPEGETKNRSEVTQVTVVLARGQEKAAHRHRRQWIHGRSGVLLVSEVLAHGRQEGGFEGKYVADEGSRWSKANLTHSL